MVDSDVAIKSALQFWTSVHVAVFYFTGSIMAWGMMLGITVYVSGALCVVFG